MGITLWRGELVVRRCERQSCEAGETPTEKPLFAKFWLCVEAFLLSRFKAGVPYV